MDPIAEQRERTAIQDFYSGANVFITGATGFLGKVLIEKLLRSCPDIGLVFLLVRTKKGKGAEERIKEIINSKCFSRLLKENPESVKKLRAVAGDIGFKGLGISAQDRQLLVDNVHVVFHAAASVNLAQHLGSAMLLNVRGTRDLLQMSQDFLGLKAFIHVSTAYSYCPIRSTEENFGKPPLDCDEAIKMAEDLSHDEIEAMTPKIIGKWPNTYSFTKAIAEGAVEKYGVAVGLPVGVYRPSIVMWTQSEPMPGWVDNFFGTIGVAAGIYTGLSHTMLVDTSKKVNMVPCDVVVNGLIAGAWDVANKWFPESKAPVYHGVSAKENELTWTEFFDEIMTNIYDKPSTKAITLPFFVPSKNKMVVFLTVLFLHYLPAILIDSLLRVMGKRPQMMRKYKTIHSFQSVVAWFCVRDWIYGEGNIYKIWDRLDGKDRALFPLDMRSMNWGRYFRDTFSGFRTYQMKESPDSIPAARLRLKWLIWLHCAGVASLVAIASGIVYKLYL